MKTPPENDFVLSDISVKETFQRLQGLEIHLDARHFCSSSYTNRL